MPLVALLYATANSTAIACKFIQVAARVRTPEAEEQWILGELVSFNPSTSKYPSHHCFQLDRQTL